MTKAPKESLFDKPPTAEEEKSKAAGTGHNSGEVSGTRLNQFAARIERLQDEQKAAGEDIRDIYAEAKSAGFDTKILRKIIARKKFSKEKLREEEELMSLYASAMQLDLGL